MNRLGVSYACRSNCDLSIGLIFEISPLAFIGFAEITESLPELRDHFHAE